MDDTLRPTQKAISSLQAGYDHTKDRAKRKQESAAASWRFDPELEQAARLKESDPVAYRHLSASTKASLGYYLHAKAAAEAEGHDLTGGDAA